ncbi:hypothetical protein OJAG_30360 [Oerskovia enterophila]|uniref:Uncharacterized protein n=1 Tax=Oerskovia enterophila TaxID=43678 RepID=A0A163QIS4_9CELL|nr:hypothetical protein OJAG_30360 [Oerskovia enterophila]
MTPSGLGTGTPTPHPDDRPGPRVDTVSGPTQQGQ